MNRLPRKRFLVTTASAIALPVAARAADAFTLRMSLAQDINTAMGESAARLASSVNRRSNGQLKIEIYPNMQLAVESATLEALRTGVVDIALTNSAILEPLLPQFQVFDLPFIFKDIPTAFRVLDGPIGSEFAALMETKGVLGLGWGTTGFRELETTTRAVSAPEDMKGLRIRIQPGAIYSATYQALGAIPVSIDLSEAFVAFSQHTVDGADLSLEYIAKQKVYTVIKHIAMTNHNFGIIPIYGSKRKVEALPAPLQKLLRDQIRSEAPVWRSVTVRQLSEDVQFLKQNGVAFTDIQYPAFRKAVEPVYAMFQPRLGADLIDRVSRAANAS